MISPFEFVNISIRISDISNSNMYINYFKSLISTIQITDISN